MPAPVLARQFVPDPATAAPRPRDAVLRDLERVETYPVLSDTAVRATALVNNPNASVAEVAEVVRRDGVIAAAVLRVVNTCKFRGRGEIGNIQQAVLRLGTQECAKLLCAIGVKGMYNRQPEAVQKRCEALLRHSLFVANLASGLNTAAKLGLGGTEFAAGLLHDIGRVIASVRAPAEAAKGDPIDFREDHKTLWKERDALGIDHSAIGYQFAIRNNLPESLVRVVLNHHRPDEEHLQRELVAVVAVADRIANHAQITHKVADYDLTECPFYEVLTLNWDRDRRHDLRDAMTGIVVESLRKTRQMLKAFAG
jgi:putative nucleotidyltransferase with HDIG domain